MVLSLLLHAVHFLLNGLTWRFDFLKSVTDGCVCGFAAFDVMPLETGKHIWETVFVKLCFY